MLRGLSVTVAAVVITLSTIVASAQEAGVLPDADNGFAFDLQRQVAGGQPGQNIFENQPKFAGMTTIDG